MKKLIFINGTMGVGKTSTCKELLSLLKPSVFLDGDWCWNMNPFIVTEESKKMVESNICFLLNNFLACSEYKYIIFCWVMPQKSIIDDLLNKLDLSNVELYKFTLSISKDALIKRLSKSINNKERNSDVLQRSLDKLPLYQNMKTIQIDVSNITPTQAAKKIIENIEF